MKYFLLLLLSLSWISTFAATSYRLNHGTNQNIIEHAVCKSVNNTHASNDYFVPTNSASEWSAFYNTPPSAVVIGACGGLSTYAYTFSANVNDVNLLSVLVANKVAMGWDGTSAANFNVTVNAGVTIGSSSAATPAFTLPGTFPAGSTINLTNNGIISGAGGKGGDVGLAGQAGGNALAISFAININNTNGYIWGGGGGGGGGTNDEDSGTGGSGGGGTIPGGFGLGGGDWGCGDGPGLSGTATAGGGGSTGAGAAGYWTDWDCGSYGTGGLGGAPGYPGGAGTSGAAGAAGYYVVGNANVTWVGIGDRRGNSQ